MTAAENRPDNVTRAARRGLVVDGLPVIVLGGLALTLGSDPEVTSGHRAAWVTLSALFTLAIARALLRSFRRADEYQRKIQLESMAIAFGAVLVALQIAGVLDAARIGELRQSFQLITIGGIVLWLVVADLRTRLHR
jgi:hypothetical protein